MERMPSDLIKKLPDLPEGTCGIGATLPSKHEGLGLQNFRLSQGLSHTYHLDFLAAREALLQCGSMVNDSAWTELARNDLVHPSRESKREQETGALIRKDSRMLTT